MIRIILLTLLLTSCAQLVMERRVICDNGFETPWSHRASVQESGTVSWYDVWDEVSYYKIPGGVTCTKEYRTVLK